MVFAYYAQIKSIIKNKLLKKLMADIETATPKGEDLVGYCAICGVEFDSKISTNRYVRCDSCESVFQVRVKTEIIEE